MIKAGIVGATGYTGVELLRILGGHEEVTLSVVTSRDLEGTLVQDHFPSLRGRVDMAFCAPDSEKLALCDVVFYATPHAVAMHTVPELLRRGVRVIDLSADFRLQDVVQWEQWYNTKHSCPELIPEAVYGLPEVNREKIQAARLVAVPGCYPTAVQLGFLPLLEAGLVNEGQLIADAKSGVSGAGRKASVDFLLCETSESIRAYGVAGHRHLPEICQGLDRASENPVKLTFIPHLVPMIRGILATLYAPVKTGADVSAESLQSLYEQRYADEPFVDVLPQGRFPDTKNVKGTNRCQLSVTYTKESNMIVALAAEDNLVKGASGQAVQNMNIMFGLTETMGLNEVAVTP